MRHALLALALAASLGGCGSDGTGSDASADESTSPTASATTESPSPTPTYTPPPPEAEVSLECYNPKDDTVVTGGANDLELFWPYRFDDCFDTTAKGTPSDLERKALRIAYPKNPSVGSLGTLYGICAENDKQWGDYLKTAGTSGQLREFRGAFVICPRHPQRKKVEGLFEDAEKNNRLIKQGRVFYSGTYLVGKDVPPGAYFAEPSGDSGCYWERTDAAGNIIDNNFSNGLRIEMTVQSSDYSIRVEGCGEWRPVG